MIGKKALHKSTKQGSQLEPSKPAEELDLCHWVTWGMMWEVFQQEHNKTPPIF